MHEKPNFWNGLALQEQRRIIADMEAGNGKSSAPGPVAEKAQAATGKVTVGNKGIAAANCGAEVEMALPYTIGAWDKTAPVEVELKAGKNVLKFQGPARVTFGKFTLTPMN